MPVAEPLPWLTPKYAARFTDIVKVDVLSALREAREVIASVDRSVLGIFARDSEVVAAHYAANFAKEEGRDPVAWENRFTTALEIYADMTARPIYPNLIPTWFTAEAWIWHCVAHGLDFDSVFTRTLMTFQTMDYFSALRRVYENPTHLSFYEAGIWDDGFISKCLAADIDAAMAQNLISQGALNPIPN